MNQMIALPTEKDQERARAVCPAFVDKSQPHGAHCPKVNAPFVVTLTYEGGGADVFYIDSGHEVLKAIMAAAAADRLVVITVAGAS